MASSLRHSLAAPGLTSGLKSREPRRRRSPVSVPAFQNPRSFSRSTCKSTSRSRSSRAGVACAASGGGPDESRYPAPKRAKEREERTLPETLEMDQEELEEVLSLELQSSFDTPPRHYEFVFLIGERRVEEIPAFLDKMKDQIAEYRGKIWRLNDWGMRPLAYKIQKQRKANYFLLNVEVSPEKANDLNTFFQKDERVIRHLMTKMDNAESKDWPAPVMYNTPMADGELDGLEDDEDEEEGDEEGDDDEEDEDEEEDGEEDDEGGSGEAETVNVRAGEKREPRVASRS